MKNVMLNQLAAILNSEKEKIVCHFLIAFSFLRYFFLFFRTTWDSWEFFSKSVGSWKISRLRQKKKNYLPKRNFYSKKKKDAILLYTEDKINKFHCTRGQRWRVNFIIYLCKVLGTLWVKYPWWHIYHLVERGLTDTFTIWLREACLTHLPFGWERLACPEWSKWCLKVAKYQWTIIKFL